MRTELLEVKEPLKELLDRLNYSNSEVGLNTFLNTTDENKGNLIDLMKNHPNYVGDLRIVDTIEIDRSNINRRTRENNVYKFFKEFASKLGASYAIIKKVNDEGLTRDDVFRSNLSKIPNRMKITELAGLKSTEPEDFTLDGRYIPSVDLFKVFQNVVDIFSTIYGSKLSEEDAERLNRVVNLKFVSGLKTSRAFNRAMEYFGFNEKHEKYKKLKPEYCEMMSDSTLKFKYVISANPIDFILGSEGNTWKSCHTSDPKNILGITSSTDSSYSGMHRLGNLSYATDGVTLITFCVPYDLDNRCIAYAPKIFRMHIHYDALQGILVQGRIYPQENDSSGTDLYKVFRTKVQKVICEMEGIEYIEEGVGTDTWIKKGSSRQNSDYIVSYGHQYPDYTSYNTPTLCYKRGVDLSGKHITIGHQERCLCCGKEIYNGYMFNCDDCEN